jgi:hypothetical protein
VPVPLRLPSVALAAVKAGQRQTVPVNMKQGCSREALAKGVRHGRHASGIRKLTPSRSCAAASSPGRNRALQMRTSLLNPRVASPARLAFVHRIQERMSMQLGTGASARAHYLVNGKGCVLAGSIAARPSRRGTPARCVTERATTGAATQGAAARPGRRCPLRPRSGMRRAARPRPARRGRRALA